MPSPQQPAITSLQDLPAEIRLQIVPQLPAISIHQFRRTCRTSWNLINENQRLSTGPGIQHSLDRICRSLAKHCNFSISSTGDQGYLTPFIDLFLVYAGSGILDWNGIRNSQDFLKFYIDRFPPQSHYLAHTRLQLMCLFHWLKHICADIERCKDVGMWYPNHFQWRFNIFSHWTGVWLTRNQADLLFLKLDKAVFISRSAALPVGRRYALTTRCTRFLLPMMRYQEHLLVKQVLGVPAPPAMAPLSYFAHKQWAQDLVFESYAGKMIDHVARAAVLEQVYLGYYKNDIERDRARSWG